MGVGAASSGGDFCSSTDLGDVAFLGDFMTRTFDGGVEGFLLIGDAAPPLFLGYCMLLINRAVSKSSSISLM